jgi:hypothetical protein
MPYTYYLLCIDYYEAFQRKKRANSWNDCHSRMECLDSKSAIKNRLGGRACRFQHVSLLSVWLQAGQYLALAAQIPAKSKAKKRLSAPKHTRGNFRAKRKAALPWTPRPGPTPNPKPKPKPPHPTPHAPPSPSMDIASLVLCILDK